MAKPGWRPSSLMDRIGGAGLVQPKARLLASLKSHRIEATVAASSLGLGLAVSVSSFLLQTRFVSYYHSGHRLSGWENFLRLGAPWQALIPVAAAGFLALVGAGRLSSAEPEPPLSLGGRETASAGQLRSAMRAERRAIGIAFLVMTGLVGVVAIRVVVYGLVALSGSGVARSTLEGVAIELGVWLAAWLAVWNWNRRYRARLEGWGVFDG